MNHPFTGPREEDLDRLESDPGSVRARAYDVVVNGWELGSGSIRIHRADLQERVFRVLGISAEEGRERFGFLLEALRYGAPPHGGIALGLDRICAIAAGATSLRDVIAFPKTTSGIDLMTKAPAGVHARAARRARPRPAPPVGRVSAPAPSRADSRRRRGRHDLGRRGTARRCPAIPGLAVGTVSPGLGRCRRASRGRRPDLARRRVHPRPRDRGRRSGQDPARPSSGSPTPPSRRGCGGTTRSSRSGAGSSRTWPGSRPPFFCAAWPGTRCRRRRPGMADAAIGGKTAVNHARGKNLLGAFHPPRVDPGGPRLSRHASGARLSRRTVEAFKAAWIADAGLAERSAAALPAILAREAGRPAGTARRRRARQGRRRGLGPSRGRSPADPEFRPHARACARGGRRMGCAQARRGRGVGNRGRARDLPPAGRTPGSRGRGGSRRAVPARSVSRARSRRGRVWRHCSRATRRPRPEARRAFCSSRSDARASRSRWMPESGSMQRL